MSNNNKNKYATAVVVENPVIDEEDLVVEEEVTADTEGLVESKEPVEVEVKTPPVKVEEVSKPHRDGKRRLKTDSPLDKDDVRSSSCRWVEARLKGSKEFLVAETNQHTDPNFQRAMFQQYAATIKRLPRAGDGLALQYAVGDFQLAQAAQTRKKN